MISPPVFVDAPHVVNPADLPGHSLEWLQAAESIATTKDDSSLTPRGWWQSNPERTVCTGLEKTLLYLRDMLQETTFQVRGRPLIVMNLSSDDFTRSRVSSASAKVQHWRLF